MVRQNKTTDDEARFKLVLMKVIDEGLRERFSTYTEAAEMADVTRPRLSRLRSGRHEQFSIDWLFKLARDTGVRLRISIDQA